MSEHVLQGIWATQIASPTAALVVRATLLLVAALTLTLLLRRASAGARHLVWASTILALLLLPLLSAVTPVRMAVLPAQFGSASAPSGIHPAQPIATAPATPVADVGEAAGSPSASAPHVDAVAPPAADRSWPSAAVILLALWGAVTFFLLGRLAVGAIIVQRIARRGTQLTGADWTTPLWEAADRLDLADAPRLVRSEQAAMPFACGIRHPIIVLPPEADQWTAERRRAVLFHELAHIRRRDLLAHTLGRLACALYWPHPLVWSAARRLRAESERACDDLVLTTGARASEYADHLLQIVTSARHSRAPAVALPMAQRREFEGRMLAILDPAQQRRLPSRRAAVALSGIVLLMAVTISGMAPADVPARLAELDESAPPVALDDVAQRAVVDTPRTRRQAHAPASGKDASDRAAAIEVGIDYHDSGAAGLAGGIAEVTAEATLHALAAAGDALRGAAVEIRHEVQDEIRRGPRDGDRSNASPEPMPRERVELMARTLAGDPSASTRRVAAWALQRSGDRAARQALNRALMEDRSVEVREMAAWALGTRGATDTDPALLHAVANDADAGVRATAAWAIGTRRMRDAAPQLAQALTVESVELRHTAAWALGQLRPSTAPAQLVALLEDRSARVRQTAAWALSEIRDVAAVPALVRALDADPRAEERHMIVRAIVLSARRDASVIDQLLESEHTDVRELAIRAAAGASHPWPAPFPWPRPRPSP